MVEAISLLRPGDEIDYKRVGMRGMYRCRVVAIRPESTRPLRVEVLSHCWAGTASPFVGTRLAITGKQVCKHYRAR